MLISHQSRNLQRPFPANPKLQAILKHHSPRINKKAYLRRMRLSSQNNAVHAGNDVDICGGYSIASAKRRVLHRHFHLVAAHEEKARQILSASLDFQMIRRPAVDIAQVGAPLGEVLAEFALGVRECEVREVALGAHEGFLGKFERSIGTCPVVFLEIPATQKISKERKNLVSVSGLPPW